MQVPLIDSYIERLTPVFRDAGNGARAQCERIITRLECIETAIREQEFQEYREITRVRLLTAAGTQNLDQVPVGVDWEAQFLTVNAAATVTLSDGTSTLQVFTSTGAQTFDMYKLVIKGGTLLVATTTADVSVYPQWKVSTAKKAHRGYIGGIASPIPDGTGDYGGPGRHAAISHIVGAEYPE